MSGRIEFERTRIIDSGSALRRHSLNQYRLKMELEGSCRLSPTSKKAERALRRRERILSAEYLAQQLEPSDEMVA